MLQDLTHHLLTIVLRAQRMNVVRLRVGAFRRRRGGRSPGAGLIQAAASRVYRRLTAVAYNK